MIPEPCATCAFWERGPAHGVRPVSNAAEIKRGWLTSVLLEWGTPGRLVLIDGRPVGYLTYAPAHLVPRSMAFPTSPVSEDAIILLTARLSEAHAGQGLGRVLVQAAVKDVARRGIRAMEAFATASKRPHAGPGGPGKQNGEQAGGARSPTPDASAGDGGSGRPAHASSETAESTSWPADHCLLPVDFFTAVGFYTVREHPAYPRMRLDVRTALGWREEVEQAVERLFSPVRSFGRRRPVGTVNQGTSRA